MERQEPGERGRADQLVEGVVAADVLADGHERARRVEQPGRVQAAGLFEHRLAGAETLRECGDDGCRHPGPGRQRSASDRHVVQRGLATNSAGGGRHECAGGHHGGVEVARDPDHDLVLGRRHVRGIADLYGQAGEVPRDEEAFAHEEADGQLRVAARRPHRHRDVDRRLARPGNADGHGLLAREAVWSALRHAVAHGEHRARGSGAIVGREAGRAGAPSWPQSSGGRRQDRAT